MPMKRLIHFAVLCVGLSLAVGRPAAASDHPKALPDCTGVLHVKPSSFMFACGDGSSYVQGIAWTVWGSRDAVGDGTLFINDCTPDCARGHFHSYAATVEAFGDQTCPVGKSAFSDIAYLVTDAKWPATRPREEDERMGCGG
jgi:hypothetical protein